MRIFFISSLYPVRLISAFTETCNVRSFCLIAYHATQSKPATVNSARVINKTHGDIPG